MSNKHKKLAKYKFYRKILFFPIGLILHCFIFIKSGYDFFDSFDKILGVTFFCMTYTIVYGIVLEHIYKTIYSKFDNFRDDK